MKGWRRSMLEWFAVGASVLASVLASSPAASEAAQGQNTPVYSDPAVVAPESHDGAESTGSLGFEGTGAPPSRPRRAESLQEFEALVALPQPGAAESAESLIGSDTRQRVYTTFYPTRAVVLIAFNEGRCSGSMIGPDTVLTAGHCVHSGGAGGSWSTGVVVYPGRDGASSPFGSCGAAWLASVVGWTQNGDEKYDYGVVKLNCNIGNTVGWFGLWWQTASLAGLPTTINGYPGDKPLEQWLSVDKVQVNQTLQIFYKNDTVGGFSGSGVWQDRPPGSPYCTGPCVMAVHAYGLHGASPHNANNHGERITKDRYTNLVNWRNAPK